MDDSDRIDTETQAKLLDRLADAFRERESLSDDGRGIELTLLDAVKRLRELEAEVDRLKDCERIAWAIANTIRGDFRNVCLAMTDNQDGQWRLCKMGETILFCKHLGLQSGPVKLTDVARAIIDAAMKEEE